MQFCIYFIHLSIFALLRSCAKETLKQKERNYAKFDFSPITEGIYNVIETEEKVLTSLSEETTHKNVTGRIVLSNKFSDI